MEHYDDIVMGSGMAGLTVASLLAHAGRKVLVLEAHDAPGGYAHTFSLGAYRFCAQVHYIFGCAPGGAVHTLLQDLNLLDAVRFCALDPQGYDHVVVGSDRFAIPNGWLRFRDRLISRFPEHADGVRHCFRTVAELAHELDQLPGRVSIKDVVTAPWRFPLLLQMRSWTVGRLFEQLRLPPRIRTILAGQCGDYLLPPGQASLLIHASLVTAYDRGAYYPEHHYQHLVGTLVDFIANASGSRVLLQSAVTRIAVSQGQVTGVETADGQRFTARRYISNMDPAVTVRLAGAQHFPARFVGRRAYPYSYGTVTLYLGLKGLDLRDHGFGSFNTWYYPHDDLDGIYAAQGERNNLSNPWLFLSTPTLHSSQPGLAPPDATILEVATHANHPAWRALRDQNRTEYNRSKKRLRERLLDILQERFVPGIRDHVDVFALGTPATNERFVRAPQGNAYGAALTPQGVTMGRGPMRSPVRNLWFANATAGWPSIGGTVSTGQRLVEQLMREDA